MKKGGCRNNRGLGIVLVSFASAKSVEVKRKAKPESDAKFFDSEEKTMCKQINYRACVRKGRKPKSHIF